MKYTTFYSRFLKIALTAFLLINALSEIAAQTVKHQAEKILKLFLTRLVLP